MTQSIGSKRRNENPIQFEDGVPSPVDLFIMMRSGKLSPEIIKSAATSSTTNRGIIYIAAYMYRLLVKAVCMLGNSWSQGLTITDREKSFSRRAAIMDHFSNYTRRLSQ